jgi:hypothetical protein
MHLHADQPVARPAGHVIVDNHGHHAIVDDVGQHISANDQVDRVPVVGDGLCQLVGVADRGDQGSGRSLCFGTYVMVCSPCPVSVTVTLTNRTAPGIALISGSFVKR